MYLDTLLLTLSFRLKRSLISLWQDDYKGWIKIRQTLFSASNSSLPPQTQRSASPLAICCPHTKKSSSHLRIKSETGPRYKQRGRPWLQQPVSSTHVFIFSLCLSTEKTSGGDSCLWHTEEGYIHSNILSGAYTLPVSLTSISGSGRIRCREDAAVLISDVLLVLSLILHWTRTCSTFCLKGSTRPMGFMRCV